MDVHTERGLGRDFPRRMVALAVRPEQKESGSEMGWGVTGADQHTCPSKMSSPFFFSFSFLSVCIIVF